jgi:hypothetical protein
MFGLVGDDLTVVLFFVGLAATFLVGAISQAGWKHPIFVGFLFLVAASFFVIGVGWPWLKDISPQAQALAIRIAKNPVAWFALIILGLSGILFVSRADKQAKALKLAKVRTEITLEFALGQTTAVASNLRNIWRWYSLAQVRRDLDHAGNLMREHTTVTIFLVFDRPIDVKQIMVSSEGGVSIPAHDLKDWGPRHAIILFLDNPAGCTVGIRARV